MDASDLQAARPSRESLLHALYEAAELEHNLMCTYLYAAFSLKDGEGEGLSPVEAEAVGRWRRTILDVAVEEMGHLAAVWNITAALGGAPRFGRGNFPLDPGHLPAGVVVKLAPFSAAAVQHFVHLERPLGSDEPDGDGFEPPFVYQRGLRPARLTPMGCDYETVGEFYECLIADLSALVAAEGEGGAIVGDPALQLAPEDAHLRAAEPVRCMKTALLALDAIILQGEGAPAHAADSHYARFIAIREELAALRAANPLFEPAHPAALNPVLRPPPRPEGRVWIEDETAAATVDLANSAYALMLRLIAYAYGLPRPSPEKGLALDMAVGLMRAISPLGERAARLPAGPSHPGCNAGMTFTALRDAAAFAPGAGARRFFVERLGELAQVAVALADQTADPRTRQAARLIETLARRAGPAFDAAVEARPPTETAAPRPAPPPASEGPGIEAIEGEALTLVYEGKRCIHARFCVTGAPKVFLANVEGPWIHPDQLDVERLVDIAHACPSGAIRYRRKDGRPAEAPPPVNLAAVREGGPYAFRGDLRIDGEAAGFRATLCRCGASKNKPFCDGSHHEVDFAASGEPPTRAADMMDVRDGPLLINPEPDGPLEVRGALEIVSGTGRVVARTTGARLCRCGGSASKPFCDGTHARIGFTSS